MKSGRLYVISGPSGVGKGTIVERLIEENPNIWKSVSATTRSPRDQERDGVDYYFVTREDFERTADNGGFLEWAEYSHNLYGTPIASIQRHLDAGDDVILEIEVQGALQVRKIMPDAVLVFIEPPSEEELERRLRGRGSELEDSIYERMETAKIELLSKMEYDISFVNDDIDETVAKVAEFIKQTTKLGSTPA